MTHILIPLLPSHSPHALHNPCIPKSAKQSRFVCIIQRGARIKSETGKAQAEEESIDPKGEKWHIHSTHSLLHKSILSEVKLKRPLEKPEHGGGRGVNDDKTGLMIRSLQQQYLWASEEEKKLTSWANCILIVFVLFPSWLYLHVFLRLSIPMPSKYLSTEKSGVNLT